MSRRHRAEKRQVLPDPKFKDIVISKFMNQIMLDGKKSTAERIVYGAFDLVEEKAKKDPVEVFHAALVVQPIRCRSKSVRSAVRPSRSAGSLRLPARGMRTRCVSVWPVSCSTPRKAAARL